MSDQNQSLRTYIMSRLTTLWIRLSPQYEMAKKVLIICSVVCIVSCTALCVSAFLFGTIYFYHMPTIQHTFPLHFQYNRSCMQQHKLVEQGMRWDRHLYAVYSQMCYPVAKVQLATRKDSHLLQEGQVYNVVVKLELPETPSNLQMGMFMVTMVVEGHATTTPTHPGEYRWSKKRKELELVESGKPITMSASRAMSLQYKSLLIRLIYKMMFWPLFMFDFLRESQTLDTMLFDNLMLQQVSRNWSASVFLENPGIDVYSGKIDVIAEFSGIQHILYRWPITSFFFGTASLFLPTLFVIVITLFCCVWLPFFSSSDSQSLDSSDSREPPGMRSHRERHRRNSSSLADEPTSDARISTLESLQTQSAVVPDEEVILLHQTGTSGSSAADVEPGSTADSRRSSSSIEMLGPTSSTSLTDSQTSYVTPSISALEESGYFRNIVEERSSEASLRKRLSQ